MNTEPTAIGLAVFLAMIIMKLLDILIDRLNKKNNKAYFIEEMAKQIKDLHAWHNVEGANGRKLWYSNVSIDGKLDKIHTTMEALREDFKEFKKDIKDLLLELRR